MGSSSESSSSESEDSETGEPCRSRTWTAAFLKLLKCYIIQEAVFYEESPSLNPGMASKPKKRGRGEGKKSHHQVVAPGMPQPQVPHQPQTPALQPSVQLKLQQHPSPAAYMPPPVTALEPSQLLENPFDPLAHFVQPLMHLPHHANDSPSPAPPHLNAHPPGGPVSPETHPFLNQHPILPSPGKWKSPVY